jgi:GrpB-like predicted nucleotidyltransferase (UPF0157 family)
LTRKVIVVPHDPNWRKQFQQEEISLREILGNEILLVHHIGSTSILTIHAKPIIDLLVEVKNIAKVDDFNPAFIEHNYIPMGEYTLPGRRFFVHGDMDVRTANIHIYQFDNRPSIERHLNFRDYMIAHPDLAREYSELKIELAKRFPEDLEGYMDGKDGFIKENERKAGEWKASILKSGKS